MRLTETVASWFIAFCFMGMLKVSQSQVPQEEVVALQQIVTEMGARYWKFNGDQCEIEMIGMSPTPPTDSEGYVDCNCNFKNNTVCHITNIVLKSLNLPGVLPIHITKLPYLQAVDFAYNLLSGTIPTQWASTNLTSISLVVNRLSGEIPKELGNLTTLTYLGLEANNFSGTISSDIGKLINLKTLTLSSNRLTGHLPVTFAALTNLNDFRISDNRLSGRIPNFIQNWKQVTRLEMQASGLVGPIPSNISILTMLKDLRISDIKSPASNFPLLISAANLETLVLRNCNISGAVPDYIWRRLRVLDMLDISFNKLVGEIPHNIARDLKTVFVTGNMLSGDIPDALLKDGSIIDLSYNNFTLQGPDQPACQTNMNRRVNLFKGSSTGNILQQMLPCTRNVACPRYKCSLHVNCGGTDLTVEDHKRRILYEGDTGSDPVRFLSENHWGFVSSGKFLDGPYSDSSRVVRPTSNITIPELYTTARLNPMSLTYFHYCLENGSYNVSLHFAEIMFMNDSTYNSLGRRSFDIYIQDDLMERDFDIGEEAHGNGRPVVRSYNATVHDSTLEIRFYWASRGTKRIPSFGVFGSLVSAISVDPNFKVCKDGDKKKNTTGYIVGPVVSAFVIFLIAGIVWWKCLRRRRTRLGKGFDGLELQTVAFSLNQIRAATNNFDEANKIGEGGFGPVYKGLLQDGTVIAVKQLSSRSRQGNREFLNEIGMFSCLLHPNLVKLHGCCIEGDQLLLVYEYMVNNSLANVLFDSNKSQMILDWPTRFKICIGIARGLAFLHDESRLKIIHRDIKATNVLLDGDMNPKISDFGLARLNEDEKTHISTKVAGTIGYMAPEYALWGYLTDKADVYSFGVVLLEIVSGKSNSNYMPSHKFICLLDWACHLQESKNIDELIDERLGSRLDREEVERVVKVALLCTNATPSVRPTMSEAVRMMEGSLAIPDTVAEGSTELRMKAMNDFRKESWIDTSLSGAVGIDPSFSSFATDFSEIGRDGVSH
ncbi:probable LRR receptor-like serine/threonine-protein kinase RFK1 [Salvia splendens]|uniref:probable LRR receptor-like serine/threonine-protein kinase RFK1 n=1 Tax=Salvia splendens TaxID=180675 RepID=UPI001C25DC5D|nr:probable LRR receptor-like serine/threonine-protein kinase RFK1 [Salvia splendens]